MKAPTLERWSTASVEEIVAELEKGFGVPFEAPDYLEVYPNAGSCDECVASAAAVNKDVGPDEWDSEPAAWCDFTDGCPLGEYYLMDELPINAVLAFYEAVNEWCGGFERSNIEEHRKEASKQRRTAAKADKKAGTNQPVLF